MFGGGHGSLFESLEKGCCDSVVLLCRSNLPYRTVGAQIVDEKKSGEDEIPPAALCVLSIHTVSVSEKSFDDLSSRNKILPPPAEQICDFRMPTDYLDGGTNPQKNYANGGIKFSELLSMPLTHSWPCVYSDVFRWQWNRQVPKCI